MYPNKLHQVLLLAKPYISVNDLDIISHNSQNVLCNFVLCPLSGTVESLSLSIAVSDTSAIRLLSRGGNLPHLALFLLKIFCHCGVTG